MAQNHILACLLAGNGFMKEAYSISLVDPSITYHKELYRSLLPLFQSVELIVDTFENMYQSSLKRLSFYVDCGVPVSNSCLFFAIEKNQYEIVEYLLSKGCDVNSIHSGYFEKCKTALMYAAEYSSLPVVQILVEKGANIHARDGTMQTALFYALGSDNIDIFNYLVEKGANVFDLDATGTNLLIHLSKSSIINIKILQYLLDFGFDINYKDANKQNALSHACGNLRFKVKHLIWFIDRGADVKAYGQWYLFYAIRFRSDRDPYILHILLRNGAKLDDCDSFKNSALYCAAQIESVSLAMLFLDYGADHSILLHILNDRYNQKFNMIRTLIIAGIKINKRDSDGRNCLHVALHSQCDISLIRLLIENGADVNARDNYGNTPLLSSLHMHLSNSQEHISLFVKRGADVNAKNYLGRSPLMEVCSQRNACPTKVEFFIKNGADVNARDNCLNTALIEAANHNNVQALELLLKAGAHIDAKNARNFTAMMCAEGQFHNCIVNALEKFGAKRTHFFKRAKLN